MSVTYDPQYVDLEDIPLTGPDPFDTGMKRKAARNAEGKLEADVNEGRTIESPESIHSLAANAYASYLLMLGPKAPDAQTMGDLADEGSERTAFADHLLAIYEDAVASIIAAEDDEGDSGGGSGGEDGGPGYTESSPSVVVRR